MNTRFFSNQTDWQIDIATDWASICDSAYIERWLGLIDADCEPNVFFHPSVVRPWHDSQPNEIKPFFVILQNRVDNEAIFYPFVIGNRGYRNCWLNTLIPAGYFLFDHHDPIVAASSPARKKALTEFFFTQLPAVLDSFPGRLDGFDIPRLRTNLVGSTQSDESSPAIDLTAYSSYEAYSKALKGAVRGDVNRQKRRLSEIGHLSYRKYTADNLPAALAEFEAFTEARSRKWHPPESDSLFFARLLEASLGETVHFSSLALNDRAISWHLGFVDRYCFYYYIPTYDKAFESYSPGKVHISMLIEECYAQGLRKFDFLRGCEKYKFDWTDRSVPYFAVSYVKNGLVLAMRRGCNNMIHALKRIALDLGRRL
ncbi:CelD/BcsL family acetyltransferase involved in cellulose biosynthesis [Sulfuritortus calidifontis]|uniref:CelD/BcsL family acetyltransferase involved in cellulose biosynthesis n=1 Tax=Sulfuritortus calidifontis TaxID=1914471 RepID=A0A4R3JVD8_9PROT|nr:GNAT family N-acetyltransferase [Sulfuritortus calidifontis]TCS71939.1 CelD/BcsL family acetyltransferase involved in cellulose biosynthesis [Sulfuritortus calidifontis]